MAATRTVLKQYFKKYATPTEVQFAALIDAFVHKDEDSLTQSKIDGLTAALESKVSSSDLASAVATAVEETLQGGNIEVTPAAHQHAIADVEGLQAFVTKVNNFLESADVSDETINRWVEIETFLTGITDQETLTGLLLNLKNEILVQIPQPQTGNYLKQISDLDAYTEAQEGEIVQYVGSTTENYTRALCYEKTIQRRDGLIELPSRTYSQKDRIVIDGDEFIEVSPNSGDGLYISGSSLFNSDFATIYGAASKLLNGNESGSYTVLSFAIDRQGTRFDTEIIDTGYITPTIKVNGDTLSTSGSIGILINTNTGQAYCSSYASEFPYVILIPIRENEYVNLAEASVRKIIGTPTFLYNQSRSFSPKVIGKVDCTVWQPIATSPVVS